MKLTIVDSPSARVRIKIIISENIDTNYTHMFDDKTEDNKPILGELDSTINNEPTLEELDAEMDIFEFTKNETWTLTADERAKVLFGRTSAHRRQQL